MSKLYAMQQDRPDTGRLLVNVSSMISSRAVSGWISTIGHGVISRIMGSWRCSEWNEA